MKNGVWSPAAPVSGPWLLGFGMRQTAEREPGSLLLLFDEATTTKLARIYWRYSAGEGDEAEDYADTAPILQAIEGIISLALLPFSLPKLFSD